MRFTEKQSVARNPLIWTILVPIISLSIWGLAETFFANEPLDSTTEIIAILSAFVLVTSLLTLLISLTTIIDEKGVHIHLSPGIRKAINWSQVKSAYITKYDKHYEFGYRGHVGIAYGRNGLRGYFITGDIGLMVITDEERILVGTKKPKELLKTVDAYLKK